MGAEELLQPPNTLSPGEIYIVKPGIRSPTMSEDSLTLNEYIHSPPKLNATCVAVEELLVMVRGKSPALNQFKPGAALWSVCRALLAYSQFRT